MNNILGVISCFAVFSVSLCLFIIMAAPVSKKLGNWCGDAYSNTIENIRTAISLVILIWVTILVMGIPVIITGLVAKLFWQ